RLRLRSKKSVIPATAVTKTIARLVEAIQRHKNNVVGADRKQCIFTRRCTFKSSAGVLGRKFRKRHLSPLWQRYIEENRRCLAIYTKLRKNATDILKRTSRKRHILTISYSLKTCLYGDPRFTFAGSHAFSVAKIVLH